MGGLNAPQTTSRAVFALFDHDTARPVEGYAAPQLHVHGVLFNMSMDEKGQYRALNPKELFYLQPFNGRDWLIDAYQEALDLLVYAAQGLAESATWGRGNERQIATAVYGRALACVVGLRVHLRERDGR